MNRMLRAWNSPRVARHAFIWPALLVVLFMAVFPLVGSLFLALSRVNLVRGGFEIQFQGLTNFRILFLGSQQSHVLGSLQPPTPLGWLVFITGVGLVAFAYWRYLRGQHVRVLGLVLRAMGGLLLIGLLWLMVQSLFSQGGRPGTVLVTFIYAIVGTAGTYLLGLGLAVLTSQRLPAQRFFRVVFLLPLAITPVGIAYMFRMLTDTQRGPFAPLWGAAGLTDFAPLGDPWGARIAVMIGDIWQWTPFMFIVLLAALESRDMDVEEAGLVDGASRRQIFRHITLPALVPVSATVILIRMIEAFKIIDLPNILTTGGPGTATESLTLQSFIEWRTFNLGQSAAIAYTLLIIVTVVALAYATTVVRRAQASV